MSDRATCPCCGHRSLPEGPGAYEVCPVCLWEDDGAPDGPYGVGGPNGYSLVHGQRRYLKQHRAHDDSPPGFRARPPREDEPRDPAWTPHADSLRDDLVLGWAHRQRAVEFLTQVAALAGFSVSDVDVSAVTSNLRATDVYEGRSLEWRPSSSSRVVVTLAAAPEDEDVSVRVTTDGDARLAERLRELLEDPL